MGEQDELPDLGMRLMHRALLQAHPKIGQLVLFPHKRSGDRGLWRLRDQERCGACGKLLPSASFCSVAPSQLSRRSSFGVSAPRWLEALVFDSKNPPTVLYHQFTFDKDIVNKSFTVRVSDPSVVRRSQGHKIRVLARVEASNPLLQSNRSSSVDRYPTNDFRSAHSQLPRRKSRNGQLPKHPVGRAEVGSQSHREAQSKHASSIRILPS